MYRFVRRLCRIQGRPYITVLYQFIPKLAYLSGVAEIRNVLQKTP